MIICYLLPLLLIILVTHNLKQKIITSYCIEMNVSDCLDITSVISIMMGNNSKT
jgi:hypothetical protein